MPEIRIADKLTLDQIKALVDTRLDAAISSRLASNDSRLDGIGTTTDAPDANGSLHAKVKNLRDIIIPLQHDNRYTISTFDGRVSSNTTLLNVTNKPGFLWKATAHWRDPSRYMRVTLDGSVVLRVTGIQDGEDYLGGIIPASEVFSDGSTYWTFTASSRKRPINPQNTLIYPSSSMQEGKVLIINSPIWWESSCKIELIKGTWAEASGSYQAFILE